MLQKHISDSLCTLEETIFRSKGKMVPGCYWYKSIYANLVPRAFRCVDKVAATERVAFIACALVTNSILVCIEQNSPQRETPRVGLKNGIYFHIAYSKCQRLGKK